MSKAMLPKSTLELASEPISNVRIGIIGLGNRGMKTLKRYAYIKGACITCIADINDEALQRANRELEESNREKALAFCGNNAWKSLIAQDNLDLVYICTEWNTHCEMAIAAMESGKHVAVEVPAATTVEECWQLVDTAEKTRKHCFMTENCCYDFFSLCCLEMLKAGAIGTPTHFEGAYIHNLKAAIGQTGKTWMERQCAIHGGNPYPTHAIGPIAWLADLYRGDKLDYIISMTPKGGGEKHDIGRVNTSLLKTHNGKSILLQLDVTTRRPYSRMQTICATEGFAQKYPVPTITNKNNPNVLVGDEALKEAERFATCPPASCWLEGKRLGVPNEMNFAMDRRFIHCLNNGLPLDIDVYDAAEWSCLAELTKISAENCCKPVEVPDFTRGRWNERKGIKFYV